MLERTRRHCHHVTPQAFVTACLSSTNTREVSERLDGMPVLLVHARAYAYRKRGVNLKKLEPRNRRIYAAELNKVAES